MEHQEMIERIEILEAKIKKSKKKVFEEREVNNGLKEENENLKQRVVKVEKPREEGKLHSANALAIENIGIRLGEGRFVNNLRVDRGFIVLAYGDLNWFMKEDVRNYMMLDLKTEFNRTQGQIDQLVRRKNDNEFDINFIRKENKLLVAKIERYKKMLKDAEEEDKEKRDKTKAESSPPSYIRTTTMAHSIASGSRGGYRVPSQSSSKELVLIEKLTTALSGFVKQDNLRDIFINAMEKCKNILDVSYSNIYLIDNSLYIKTMEQIKAQSSQQEFNVSNINK